MRKQPPATVLSPRLPTTVTPTAASSAPVPQPTKQDYAAFRQKALVTGGGRGIGRGVVDRFLEEGARVAVVPRRPLDPDLQCHTEVFGIQADLADTANLPAVVDQVVDLMGGVDILVNDAGIIFERSVAEITPEEWDRMIAVNLRAPLFLAQAVLPQLRRAGGGSIINIGSIEGFAANPGHAAYAASKAGIHGMTRALALNLGADNIRCNAIAPGWITFELSETYLAFSRRRKRRATP